MRTTANIETLKRAMDAVNEKYDNNIIFNRLPIKLGNRLNFTLKVRDSKKLGHRIGFHNRRRLACACWHVHGDFFDRIWELEPTAIVWAGSLKMESQSENWQDRNIGSIMNPLMFSEACDC